ncbi:MAG: OadG family protein [Lentisphaerae bacterium]|jgi:sodium pump decarboxylase gamma subunit|nr:OadG family protein [Lentisphaerota bacterium]MBT5608796.1 OadG family protein [Lentisphaerota bacterium]MBT7058307.1 OadG family protein [Lentisphaerota bacterium]MBT7840282.1 OadG family protein [Lentisphaerota bacterium]
MNTLNDGLLLMALGMGTVFAFLVIMSLWIGFSSRLLAQSSPDADATASSAPAAGAPAAPQDSLQNQGILIAVLSAAIERYRAERQD